MSSLQDFKDWLHRQSGYDATLHNMQVVHYTEMAIHQYESQLKNIADHVSSQLGAKFEPEHVNWKVSKKGLSMSFLYDMREIVRLRLSGESGIIIGRAEYAEADNSYLVRYKAADGRLTEAWWSETAIESQPEASS